MTQPPPDAEPWRDALYSTDPKDHVAYANRVLTNVARDLGLEKDGEKPFAVYDVATVTPEEVAQDVASYRIAQTIAQQGLTVDPTTPEGYATYVRLYGAQLEQVTPIATKWIKIAHEWLLDKKTALGLTFDGKDLGFAPVFLGDVSVMGRRDTTHDSCSVKLPAQVRYQQLQDAANTWHETGHAIGDVLGATASVKDPHYRHHVSENLADTFMSLQMIARYYGSEGTAYIRDRAASRLVDIGYASRDNQGEPLSLTTLTTPSMQSALAYAQTHDLSTIPPARMFALAQTLTKPMDPTDFLALEGMLQKRGPLPEKPDNIRALGKTPGIHDLERRFLFGLAKAVEDAPTLTKNLLNLNPMTTNPQLRGRLSLDPPLAPDERVELAALNKALRDPTCPPFDATMKKTVAESRAPAQARHGP